VKEYVKGLFETSGKGPDDLQELLDAAIQMSIIKGT
jgi:hypothetical protein